MSKIEAQAILSTLSFNARVNFHTLSSSEVGELITHADAVKYRAPKNANGSRARYFHAFLMRKVAA